MKREKQLMASCDCPWMVNLVTSFQDASNLYLLLESVMGGEFYTFLVRTLACMPTKLYICILEWVKCVLKHH